MDGKLKKNKIKTIVGIRPTGRSPRLHIGHYFSVIKPALEENADVLIAKYHASPPEDQSSLMLYYQLLNLGIEANIQEVDEALYFKLLSVAKMGELQRMIQYKSAKTKTPHLLLYPVLMAHDLYGYHRVIVGEDQKQHIEYANVLFKRLGLPIIKGDYRGGRIMSLVNPKKKMSKSEPEGCLFLDDNFELKLKRAVTSPEGIKNLSYIAKQFDIKWDKNNNFESKKKLAEALNNCFKKKK